MSDRRGAEFAPSIVVGYVTETGGFYATTEDVPTFTSATGNDIRVPYVEAVRHLSCDDPDDMRAIWRLAAIDIGAHEEDAARAVMVRSPTSADSRQWTLRTGFGLSEWWCKVEGADIKHATSALCAHVWGPK